MNKDEKPLSIIKEDFLDNLIRSINESGLPMFIVEYILRDVLNNVHSLAAKQYELDLSNYKKENRGEEVK